MSDNTNFPTDTGFDDWDFGNDSSSQSNSQENDMWENPNQQSQTQQSNDLWGNTTQQGSTMWEEPVIHTQQNDDMWATPQQPHQNNDMWGNQGSQFINDSDNWAEQQTAGGMYMQDSPTAYNGQQSTQQEYINNPRQNNPKDIKLGKKSVGLIIALAFVFVALILLFLDNIKITKNESGSQQNQVQNEQNVNQGGNSNTQQPNKPSGGQTSSEVENSQQEENTESNKPSNNVKSVTLVEVPYSTNMIYSSDVYDANGKVIDKTKYVQGNQVLYCIDLQVVIGNSNQTVRYYCNYASYNAVSVGEMVVITYQQVNDTFISINSIAK